MSQKYADLLWPYLLTSVLAACGTPTDYFYTLSSEASERSSVSGTAFPSIVVGPVILPEVVDRPQIVTRVGTNQVNVAEQHRWAASLKSEIPRVIAQNLSSLLGTSSVFSYEDGGAPHPEIQVTIYVERFDAMLGQTVMIDSLWTIRSAGGKPALGRAAMRETIVGNGYDALVSAHSRALAALSQQIAEAIRLGKTTGP
jgi:uncharacterized protein